ncbi:helix-turn-helix domain-containing protein [Aquimarina sp. AU474]|uniref:helix-turn-helix domain-containing protein n=1 Tax=Aquimarina sp. AU474 TaxID=2108529 RepID=UPI000D68A99B|nr:helix-turn-helix domain-containing protein [Aquimarina sp. AU474]
MKNNEQARRIKEIRNRKGFSQEELSEESGLSLRTIQRIENGETTPHGDSLKKLAIALQVSPDDIIDWQIREDNSLIAMLNLSQLGFLAFPLLGILIPLVIWILNKDKIKNMNSVGKSILNFQISWTLSLFIFNILIAVGALLVMGNLRETILSVIIVTVVLYIFNLFMIIKNTIFYNKKDMVNYKPTLNFLN